MSDETLHPPNIAKEVGQKLVEVADGVLAENLGREAEPQEIADLAETMVSRLLSGAYLIVRDRGAGPKEAEAWLKKTLALGATLVRMSGSDAFIKLEISVREVPNKIAAKSPAPSEQLAPIAPCTCSKDRNGRCPDCSKRLAIAYREFFVYLQKMAEFQEILKDLCKACGREQLDYSISTIVGSLFDVLDQVDADKKAIAAQQMLQLLCQMATGQGIRDIPLTIKAWKDLMDAKGIKVEDHEMDQR